MISGIIFTAAYIIFFKFVRPDLNNASHWFMGISPEGIGSIGMLINAGVALIVHKFTGDATPEMQALVENIRYPKGAGRAIEH